jgi:hypothetical protein
MAIYRHPNLKKCLKYIRSSPSTCQHHTIIPAAIDILPMQPRFDQYIENLKMSFETSPMQWIRFHVFVIAENNNPVLWFLFEVLNGCSFGN